MEEVQQAPNQADYIWNSQHSIGQEKTKYTELKNIEIVPTIKELLGREGFYFIQALAAERARNVQNSAGLFQMLDENSNCSKMKHFCHCNTVNYSETVIKGAKEWMGSTESKKWKALETDWDLVHWSYKVVASCVQSPTPHLERKFVNK